MQYLKKLFRLFRSHPLTCDQIAGAFGRVLCWRMSVWLLNWPMAMRWINGTYLLLERGRNAAVMNWYVGLVEYQDMSFLLHYLRPGDLFLDVGANIGSYTVLAAGAIGAETIAVEPHPDTRAYLSRNVRLNDLADRVRVWAGAVGASEGTGFLTHDLDSGNRLVRSDYPRALEIATTTIDSICAARRPTCIKMDIEGGEFDALMGAEATLNDPALHVVLVEVNDNTIRAGHSPEDINSILRNAGFLPFGYDPKTRRLTSHRVANSQNWIYVRDRDFVESRTSAGLIIEVLGKAL